jgi:mono/diheme cytochrome c family protein
MRFLPLISVLLLLSCAADPPSDITDPGQLLFLGYAKKEVNCSRCHGAEGQGGQDAPDIRDAFSKHTENDIIFFIENGKGEGKDVMPALEGELTEAELRYLLRFLKTLSQQDTPPNQTPR